MKVLRREVVVYKVNNGPTWTETKIARLRELSMEGVSTSEIGRRLGVSKNAVVGKRHRLGLPARPSPIMRDGRPRPTRVPLVRSQTPLPALRCLQQRAQTCTPAAPDRPMVLQAPAPALPPAVSPTPYQPRRKSQPCGWPIGEPRTPGFRFCDAKLVSGKPYCAEHMQLAYVKVRDRRDDAAWRPARWTTR